MAEMTANFCGGRPLATRHAEFLYNELRWWTTQDFTNTARTILTKEIYFPKLKTWFEVREHVRGPHSQGETKKEKVDCEWCDGFGLFHGEQYLDGRPHAVVWRGRCPHSATLSKSIPIAPAGKRFSWPQVVSKTISDNGLFEPEAVMLGPAEVELTDGGRR